MGQETWVIQIAGERGLLKCWEMLSALFFSPENSVNHLLFVNWAVSNIFTGLLQFSFIEELIFNSQETG